MVIVMQRFPRSGHADVGHVLQLLGVRDDQFTYRHLKPQQPSQRAEHAHYVNGDSWAGEHFLLIFQPKSRAMYP
jgi:hypothetical protein